jgi:hypothetical protein
MGVIRVFDILGFHSVMDRSVHIPLTTITLGKMSDSQREYHRRGDLPANAIDILGRQVTVGRYYITFKIGEIKTPTCGTSVYLTGRGAGL